MVKAFSVEQTPYLVVFQNEKTLFEGVVDDTTVSKIREAFLFSKIAQVTASSNQGGSKDSQASGKSQPSQDKGPVWSSDPFYNNQPQHQQGSNTVSNQQTKKPAPPPQKPAQNQNYQPFDQKNDQKQKENKQSEEEIALAEAEKQLKEAQKLNVAARKDVERATKALNEAKKQMVEYADVEKASYNAEKAQKATDAALATYQKAKQKLDAKFKRVRADVRDFQKIAPQPKPSVVRPRLEAAIPVPRYNTALPSSVGG